MKKSIIALIIMVWGCAEVMAQSSSHSGRLPWVDGKFPAKKGAFEYQISRGEAPSLKDARNDVFNSLLTDLGNKAGVRVNSQTISEVKSDLKYSNNSMKYDESQTTATTYKIDRDGFKASFTKVSEYYEYINGKYQLWELYEVSQSGQDFKPFIPEYTDRYGINAAWRSMIIPGWGQFHKGNTGKGIFFLATEVAAGAGIVFFEMKRADNVRLSQETTNMDIIKEYRDRADKWALYRNATIGVAAGVYAWNLLDAALTKGKMRYAWIPDNVNLTSSEMFGNYYCGIAIKF